MKKEKMITRTIYSYKVTVMGIDGNDVATKDFEIPVMDESRIMAHLHMICGSFIPAKVINLETVETLYGMPESVFMAHAEKLPPRKQYVNPEKVEG